MKYQIFLCAFLLCFGFPGLHAQGPEYNFEYLTDSDGLSQNSVWSIYQDEEGFMWFGTQDGLNKYDGYNFTILKPDPDNPERSLKHNRIMDIEEDTEGRLWVATWGGGLNEVDKKTGEVASHVFGPENDHKWKFIHSFYEDGKGFFWATATGGLIRLDPESMEFTLYPSEEIWQITYVAEDKKNRFWVVSSDGLYLFDREDGKYLPHGFNSEGERETPPSLSGLLDSRGILWMCSNFEGLYRFDTREENPVLEKADIDGLNTDLILPGIHEDKDEFLWLCTGKGLFRINRSRDTAIQINPEPFKPGGLNHRIALSIYEDKEGILWFGTEGGINKMLPENRYFRSFQITPSFFSRPDENNNIQTIIQDGKGDIWLSVAGDRHHSVFRKGLYRYELGLDSLMKFTADDNALSNENIISMFEDSKKRFWITSENGLYLYQREKNSFRHYPAELHHCPIQEDRNGKLWVYGNFSHNGTAAKCAKLQSFDPETGTFQYYEIEKRKPEIFGCFKINDFTISKTGKIWTAHALKDPGSISVIDPLEATITHFNPDQEDPESGLRDKEFRTIYQDRSGLIWAGSNLGGLHRYDPDSGRFTYYTTKDGLPSNHIVSIIEDNSGYIWAGTNKGLVRLDPESGNFRNFNINDGLPANQFRERSAYARDNMLMFGTVNGFIYFNPDSIKINTTVPPVHITAFNVMEEKQNIPDEGIILPHNKNFVSFEFVALNYENPEKNQYKYKLEGLDQSWIQSGSRRFASYSDLDPGTYTFYVKGSNNNNIWNEQPASLSFTIRPPFWRTNWAYAFYIILVLGLLFIFRQQTIRRERLKSRLQLQTMEAEKMQEMDQLKTRFFSNISHEFRTPLTLILSPLEKFISDTRDEDKRKVFQMMQRNTHRLLNLINQLLDLSKLESGKASLQESPMALNPFLKNVVFSFSSMAESKQINYRFRYPEGDIVVHSDQDKLEKILVNLLSNAFKYTPSGGEVIFGARLLGRQENEGKTWLEIEVRDNGRGMSEEQQKEIFNRFYRIKTEGNESVKGTGIGLALVSELVDLFGGEISVESEPGKGSKFTVRLPLKIAEYNEISVFKKEEQASPDMEIESEPIEEEPETDEIEEDESASGPTVLIVEDNADLRSFIRGILGEDYSVEEAENGVEGLHKATREIPDLIISDLMMPGMDGIELAKQLKQEVCTSHIPLIMLTAKASETSQVEGFTIGADAYMTKPFKAGVIKARVANLIENRRKLRERFSRNVSLEPSSVEISSVDEKFIKKVKEVMEEHMSDLNFGVDQFSEEMHMSRIQFHRKLKAITNHTPAELIRTTRIKRAAELLEKGAGTVGEVAFMVGFNYSSYFTKCFYKQYGKKPSEYVAEKARVKDSD